MAPGSLLQFLFVRERVRRHVPPGGSFVDIGAGSGELSSILLSCGLHGAGFDLNELACTRNRELNRAAIRARRYEVHHEDFCLAHVTGQVDLIVCSMVIEHLPVPAVDALLGSAARLLKPSGILIVLVPGSPEHWGIEDDIAGHLRRYRQSDFPPLALRCGLSIRELRGLTYPLSNFLLPLSNWLVRRSESDRLKLDPMDRTIASGARDVAFKTTYPAWTRLLINPITLQPFHLLQKLAARCPRSLVIYCEMSADPPRPSSP